MPATPVIVVVGSLNIDYIASVDSLPRAGQTVAARNLVRRFGGKGANQAIAASRQGAEVHLISCVGAGDEGRAYRERLRAEGINTDGILTTTRALTGTALIAVDRAAENLIIVGPGANSHLTPAHVRANKSRLRSADAVLLQFEIPMPCIVEAIRLANRAGVAVVLNPSPLRADFPWGQASVNTLVANVGEAESIFGRKVARLPRELASWRSALRRRQIERLLITRGAGSTYCLTSAKFLEVPTIRVRPVDTVGAGDAFAGTFAAHLAEGCDDVAAIRSANCAGALATLTPGAQESIPGRSLIERTLRKLRGGSRRTLSQGYAPNDDDGPSGRG